MQNGSTPAGTAVNTEENSVFLAFGAPAGMASGDDWGLVALGCKPTGGPMRNIGLCIDFYYPRSCRMLRRRAVPGTLNP